MVCNYSRCVEGLYKFDFCLGFALFHEVYNQTKGKLTLKNKPADVEVFVLDERLFC